MSGKCGTSPTGILIGWAVQALTVLSGCDTLMPQVPLVARDAPFEKLWSLYASCRSNVDPYTAWLEAQQLAELTRASRSDGDLPEPLNRWVGKPPVRLSVDPRAMAASCWLHAAELQQAAGWDGSAALLRTLIQDYPDPDYAYYVSQARLGLLPNAVSLSHLASPP